MNKDLSQLKGFIGGEQLQLLKKKHGKVHAIVLEDMVAYFKEPGTDEYDAYFASFDDEHVSKRWKTLVELLMVGGCEQIDATPKNQMALHNKLQALVVSGDAELVEL